MRQSYFVSVLRPAAGLTPANAVALPATLPSKAKKKGPGKGRRVKVANQHIEGVDFSRGASARSNAPADRPRLQACAAMNGSRPCLSIRHCVQSSCPAAVP